MRYAWWSLGVLLVAILAAVIYREMTKRKVPKKPSIRYEIFTNRSELIIWTAPNGMSSDFSMFKLIEKISAELNYTLVRHQDEDNNWDVLWTHEYFFDKFTGNFRKLQLKEHQLINHVPSITFLTNKLHLGVSTTSRYIPSSFNFPALKNEFLYFAKISPNSKFLMKNMDKGGVEMVPFDDVNLNMGTWKFLQAYISPRLIYGHAFDIGVYVLITSADPLRIYRWTHDSYVRFCSEKFAPFNYTIAEKYNCAENYKNIWEMPQLVPELNSTNMEIITNILTPGESRIDDQITDAIVTVILDKNRISTKYSNLYVNRTGNKLRHFFELLRFDFVVDNDFDVYLLEINMSPDMDFSDEANERNQAMSEGVLGDTLKLIGAGSYEDYAETRSYEVTPETNALIDLFHCKDCNESCDTQHCDLCLRCMPEDMQEFLYQAYREKSRLGRFKKVFPSKKYHDQEARQQMTDNTRKVSDWMNSKCDQDDSWC